MPWGLNEGLEEGTECEAFLREAQTLNCRRGAEPATVPSLVCQVI